jgi:hypothetical protein
MVSRESRTLIAGEPVEIFTQTKTVDRPAS